MTHFTVSGPLEYPYRRLGPSDGTQDKESI